METVATDGRGTFVALLSGAGRKYVGRSDDGGRTWKTLEAFGRRLDQLVFAAGTWVAASQEGDIHVSLDDGRTWDSVYQGRDRLFSLAYVRDGVLIAGAQGGVLRSLDGGGSWQFETMPFDLVVESLAYGDGVWMGVGEEVDGTVYVLVSQDLGASWIGTVPELPRKGNGPMRVRSAGGSWVLTYPRPDKVLADNRSEPVSSAVYRSLDRGRTWKSMDTGESAIHQVSTLAYGGGRWFGVGRRFAAPVSVYSVGGPFEL